MAMRAILYSFGGSEQDANGKLVLNSKNTVEAVGTSPLLNRASWVQPPYDAGECTP